jgi:predicted permease
LSELLSINLPIFILIGVGYAAAHFRLMDKQAGEGVSDYVFFIATPALVLKTMSAADSLAAQPWGYWSAYFIGVAIVWALAMWLDRRLHATSYSESVVAGFSAGQSNTVLVGIPVIIKAFGDAGAVPLFLLIAVHLTAAIFLFEGRKGLHWTQITKQIALHPMTLALVAGLALRAIGMPPSGPVKTIVDLLADTTIPCALVAMGLALHHYGVKTPLAQTSPVIVLKLILHPAIVYLLAFHVFDMPPVWAGVAVLFAAMPTGINAFLFAARYRTGEALASSCIALSTGLAVFSTFFWLWILGLNH